MKNNRAFSKRFNALFSIFALFIGMFIFYIYFLAGIDHLTETGSIDAVTSNQKMELAGITKGRTGLIILNNLDSRVTKVHARVNRDWMLDLELRKPIGPNEFGIIELRTILGGKGEIYLVALDEDRVLDEMYTVYDTNRLG